jgi:hypothetical protein
MVGARVAVRRLGVTSDQDRVFENRLSFLCDIQPLERADALCLALRRFKGRKGRHALEKQAWNKAFREWTFADDVPLICAKVSGFSAAIWKDLTRIAGTLIARRKAF